jgi:putative endonuclease
MNRRAAERSGHRAELLAGLYLQLKGYRILARRYKTPVGEIDLIIKRGHTIAFVEVKGRRDRSSAAESIHGQNQARVVRAAQWWLSKHGQYIEHAVRFDVCLIAWYRGVHHIAHAFTASA